MAVKSAGIKKDWKANFKSEREETKKREEELRKTVKSMRYAAR